MIQTSSHFKTNILSRRQGALEKLVGEKALPVLPESTTGPILN